MAAVVGNEDGAHHVAAEVCQALAEVGFTIPTGGVTYWAGEAMGDKNYIDWPGLNGSLCLPRMQRTSRNY